MPQDRQVAARSIWWALLESGGLTALSLGSVVVYGRVLSPRDFGIVAIALGIVHLFGVLADSLFSEAIVQRRDLSRAHMEAAFATSMAMGIVFALICWFGQSYMAAWLGEPELDPVIGVVGLTLLCCGVNGVLASKLRREMRFKELATRSLVGRIAGAVVGIAMAFSGFGLWSLVGQHMVMTILAAAMLFVLTPDRPMPRFSAQHVRELLGYGVPSMCGHLLGSGTQRGFTILAGYFLGTTALGHLNLAFRVVDTLRDAVASALSQMALPLLARRQTDAKSFAAAFRKATSFTTTISMPVFMGILVCAPEAVTITFGDVWLPAVPLVQILCAFSLLYFSRMYAGPAISALGKPHFNLLTGLIGSTATLGAMALFQPHVASLVALIWGLQMIAPLPLTLWTVRTFARVPIREQASAASRPLFATLVMTAVLVGLRYALPPEFEGLIMLAVLVPVGAVTYLATIWLLSPSAVMDIADFLLTGLRRKRT